MIYWQTVAAFCRSELSWHLCFLHLALAYYLVNSGSPAP
jgi:hypothetical protein